MILQRKNNSSRIIRQQIGIRKYLIIVDDKTNQHELVKKAKKDLRGSKFDRGGVF